MDMFHVVCGAFAGFCGMPPLVRCEIREMEKRKTGRSGRMVGGRIPARCAGMPWPLADPSGRPVGLSGRDSRCWCRGSAHLSVGGGFLGWDKSCFFDAFDLSHLAVMDGDLNGAETEVGYLANYHFHPVGGCAFRGGCFHAKSGGEVTIWDSPARKPSAGSALLRWLTAPTGAALTTAKGRATPSRRILRSVTSTT